MVEHLLLKFELAGTSPTSEEQRAVIIACPGSLQGALTTEVMRKKTL